MPTYNSPITPPKLLMKGVPCYLMGSYSQQVGVGNYYVTNVALTSNVATVAVQNLNGPLPVVGGLISITGTTSTSGLFNVTRAVITGTTVSASTGAGNITFALTHANVTSAADSGTVIIEPNEVGEALANGKSIPCCIQAPDDDSQFTAPFSAYCPSMPTAATITLQVAIRDVDAEYTNTTSVVTIAGGAYTAGPVVEATLQRGYFYRAIISGVSGGSSPTLVAKVG